MTECDIYGMWTGLVFVDVCSMCGWVGVRPQSWKMVMRVLEDAFCTGHGAGAGACEGEKDA